MGNKPLIARVGARTVVVVGAIVGLAVMFRVDNQAGFGWATLAFVGVLAPCLGVARLLWWVERTSAAREHGRPRAEGEARYCARCGLETRTADPTCTFCGSSRFTSAPPQGVRRGTAAEASPDGADHGSA